MAAPERMLLASMIRSREAYDKIRKHITDKDLNEQSALIVRHLDEYYERDAEARSADAELLAGAIARSLSNPKHKELFGSAVRDLASLETSPANVVADFFGLRREAAGARLASALAAGRGPEDVAPLIDEYQQWVDSADLEDTDDTMILQGAPVAEILAESYGDGARIKVFPKALNERLNGGLLRGHHVVVFARPEVGKTMVVINMVAGFLRQNLRVLYVGNEDPVNDLVLRVISRLTGMTTHDILADPQRADGEARARGYDNLILASLAPGTVKEVEALMLEYKPDVVVVDQLRNLNSFGKEENLTRKLEQNAMGVRALGKKYQSLMVSVVQAGDSATNKAVLEMGDVDSSNTGIPATADVMVGIGMTTEDEQCNRRVFSLPKNKPGANHSYFPVSVNPGISKVSSL